MIKLLFKIKSFKTKIITIIVSISFLVLSVASISLGWVLDKNFKENLDESARASLSILAYNLAPAVSFNDEEGVSQILSSFRTSVDVVNATVYQLDENKGLVFLGDYSTNNQYRPIDNVKNYLSRSFIDTHYKLLLPIKVDDETIGYIYQHAIFDRINIFHTEMINTISTIFLLCLLFSVLISLKLQKILLKPLSHLIKTTQEVRYKKDYSIRVKQVSDDEFFYLAVNFNHMLDEIDNQYKKQLLIEEEVRQLNLFLEDKVNARTIELKVANKYLMTTLEELEQSKHQLVEQEKMASLGALVAGIAHEINTPVGIGVTAVSHLDDMANELNVKVKSKKLSQKYLESFIEKTLAGTKMSLTNLSRAADLISSFKMIAVDQSSDNLRTFPFKQYLHEILLSLQPQFKGLNHKITISCDEKINIYGNAGAIAQIFTNLLMNTLLHGFENKNSGNINIEVNLSGDDIEFDYSDDGCGMSQALLMKLFDPFFTTKRDNGGSGLGAHLIYNLVTQALHGRIVATSVMGEGLHFKIVFPKKAP